MNLLPFDDQLPDEQLSETPSCSGEQPETPAKLPDLLTIRELARALKLSPRSVWRLVRNQQLPSPIRIGGSIRWRADEITRWIDDGCQRIGGDT